MFAIQVGPLKILTSQVWVADWQVKAEQLVPVYQRLQMVKYMVEYGL